MAVDAGIYGQIRPYAPENPLNALARVLQVKSMQDESAMRRMQMDDLRRRRDEENRLRELLASLPDGEAGVAALTRGGFLTQARQLAESQAKVAKDRREQAKFDLDVAQKKVELIGRLAGSARDQATWERALQTAAANGIDISNEPRQFDENYVAQMRQMALTAAQQIEARRKAARDAEESANRAIVIGQDGKPRVNPLAVEAKSRIAQAGASNINLLSPVAGHVGGRDVLVQPSNKPGGEARIVTVGGQPVAPASATKKLDQEVARFAKNLQDEGIPEFEKVLTEAENVVAKYAGGDIPGYGRIVGGIPTSALPDEARHVRQTLAALRNIILKSRSGAAVTDQELRRLVEEIGAGFGMSDADVVAGIRRIRDRFETIKSNLTAGVSDDVLSTYIERGGLPLRRGVGGSAPAVGGKPVHIKGDEDYAKLPSGALFIGPDGKVRRKP